MKTKLTLLALLISIVAIAQNGINYKALIKDANGNVIANSNVDVQIAIEIFTVPIYIETHNVNTDTNGLIILNIGEGTVVNGTFENIDWKNDRPSLNVQVDIGNGYVDLGSTSFKVVPYAIRALQQEGLVEVFEGDNRGLRKFNADSDNHGNIGEAAVDLSTSGLVSTDYGATGDYAFASGNVTTASGANSTAMGRNTEALGTNSTALGVNSTALGNSSFAVGAFTDAEGINSIAMGRSAEAAGTYTSSIGNNTRAQAYNSTAIGRYNVGIGSTTTWNNSDPLFEVGNGTSDSNRSNALTISKNGVHTINSDGIGLNVYADTFGIFVFDPDSDGVYIQQSGDDGIQIVDSGNDGITISNSDDDGIEILNSSDNGIDITDSDGNGIEISNSGTNGMLINGTQTYGATITGDSAGLRARATVADNPDIILRGNSNASTNAEDDGIISSDPVYGGSDLYIRSYDAIVMQLDYNDNESGNFTVRNSSQDVVFDVNESGNVSFDGSLQLGNGTVECPLPDIRIDSNDDVLLILDNDNNELGFFGIYNGNTSNVVFQVTDSGDALLTGNLTQLSDRRLKKDIEDLNYGLKEILQLSPKEYYWKDESKKGMSLGLIAQDVKPIIKDIVNTQDDDKQTLGISYIELIPVLINAIKEQQKIIDNEKSINTKQNTQLEALLSRVEQLESKSSN